MQKGKGINCYRFSKTKNEEINKIVLFTCLSNPWLSNKKSGGETPKKKKNPHHVKPERI